MKWLFTFFIFIFSQGSFANKQEPIEIYQLKTNSILSISEVIDGERFSPSNEEYINYGYFEHFGWLKFDFTTKTPTDWILQFNQIYIDTLQVFIVKNNQVVFQSDLTGSDFLKQRHFQYYQFNSYLFPFRLDQGNYTCYISMQSQFSPLRAKLSLWKKKDFSSRSLTNSDQPVFWHVIYGMVALAAFVGILFFLFTKRWINVMYSVFIVINILNLAASRGLIGHLLPWLAFSNHDPRGILNTILVFTSSLYIYGLVPKQYANKWVRKLLIAITLLGIAFLVISLSLPETIQIYYYLLFVFKPILFVSFYLPVIHFVLAIRNGHKLSRFFLFGYSGSIISSSMHILQTFEFIAFSNYNKYWDWEMSMFMELLVFSIAFAYEYHQNAQQKLALANQLNEDRKNYLEKYYLSQDNERKRIAKNLHDSVIQQLVSLKFGIRSSAIANKEELLATIDQSTEELRDLSHQLMPKSLSKLGLEKAMEGLLSSAFNNNDIQYDYDYFGINQRLPENIELNLYRIVQELTTNVIKHSNASKVDVQLYQLENDLHLIFEDNGRGFNIAQDNMGIGLESIKSRVDSVNGDFRIESPAQGTTITIKLPLEV